VTEVVSACLYDPRRVLDDRPMEVTHTRRLALLLAAAMEIRDEIIRINTEARPVALQIVLVIPILAGLLGFLNSFRMARLPEPVPAGGAAEMALG
jgi:hypothetical protein